MQIEAVVTSKWTCLRGISDNQTQADGYDLRYKPEFVQVVTNHFLTVQHYTVDIGSTQKRLNYIKDREAVQSAIKVKRKFI